jgi:hypothetical protein
MNLNFDLDIKNYTIRELEDLFELPNNYDETIIEIQETKLRHNIISDRSIMALTKNNTLDFINKVKKALTENLKKNLTPSTNVAKLAKNWENIYNMNKTLESSDVINAGSTNIIKRPTTPYGQSSPSEFYQGTINPLNKRILRQNINIDTRFRDNYYTTTASNFHVNLPLRLTEVVSLQLSALELPNTFYVVSQVFGNNFFVLETPGVEPLVVTIPDGNYDYLALQNYINSFLTTLGPGNPYSNIQFVADANTPGGSGPQGGSGKMIVGSTTGTLNFSINFLTDRYGNEDRQTPLPLKLGWLMGFRNGYYENNTTYISEGIINLLGPRYIYLVVDDFNNSVLDGFYGAFTSSILNKNILARISLQGSVFNYLSKDNFNLISTPRQYFGPVDIQKLQIQLIDEYGRILNLNNMDYSFCLTFQTVYDL